MADLRAYNVMFGLFQAPYYAFSQTMMAELTPPGFENMVRDRIAEIKTSVQHPHTLSCSSSACSDYQTVLHL